jgi:hypothetical protein
LVGWIFFDFFRVFFLAILFSLTRLAHRGTAALICNANANVHIHFLRHEISFSLAFRRIRSSRPSLPAALSVEFFTLVDYFNATGST